MADKTLSTEEKIDALIRGVKRVLEAVEVEKPKIIRRPASTNFYNPNGGQLQFAVGSPRWGTPEDKDGLKVSYIDKEGAVFIEAAPPDPDNKGKLDWKNRKIVFALSDKDIAAIVFGLESGKTTPKTVLVNLTHTTPGPNGDVVKYFKVIVGDRTDKEGNPTYFLELGDMSVKNRVSVPVTAIDVTRLRLILSNSLSKILGWDVV